jgi:cytochrome P450
MEEGKEEWPDDYLVRLMLNFTFAGHETTTNASGNAVMNLLTMRDRWEALVADPSKIPNAVNECLRIGSSIIAWRRQAVVDTELSGVTIPAGAKLLIYNGAANRDPAVFENPQEFDIERENATRLLSFGFGPHLCLGQPVAKLEMKIMLEELTRRLPHIQLETQEFTFSPPNTTARGPDEIWATWDPAKNPVPEDRP